MNDFVTVKIVGFNLIRIIEKLIENNVCVTNVIKKLKYIKFTIQEKDLIKLDKICKIERKFYKIVQKNGIKQIICRIPYMFGSIFALLLCYIYLFSTSLYIVNVNVSYKSNSTYNVDKINNLLKLNKIESGMKKSNWSISKIQNLIMLNIDDIEGCKVEYNGNILDICIYPAVNKYENSLDNIYSMYDAVIESAEAFSGNLKVKAGDIIKAGDILIENDKGASGKIKGKVYFTATKIYNENQQILNYTGKEYILKDYVIFDKFIIKDRNLCNFKQYLVENCSFFITKNLFIPIKCNKTIIKEVSVENVIIPFSQVENEIKDNLLKEAKQKIQDENTITNITYSVVNENNYTRVDCFIETLIDLF